MAGDGRLASSDGKGPGLKGDKEERRVQGLSDEEVLSLRSLR